jgi:hypothetical protein
MFNTPARGYACAMASRLLTTLSWPVGVSLTAWIYIWRTTPLHRREVEGDPGADREPPLPAGTRTEGIQAPESGSGDFLRRRYRGRIAGADLGAEELIARIREDPDAVAPSTLARFRRERGPEGRPLDVGDEYTVHMPGPWDGPVRVVEATPTSFRFATLEGHLEAGQIEWRACERDGDLVFEIESWSRPGDRASDLLHHHLKMAKEVQLHMWTTVLEKVARLSGGRLPDGIDIETRVVPAG